MHANRKRYSRRSEKRRPKEEERKNWGREVTKAPRGPNFISLMSSRTLCAGCSANTSILCSIAAKYASISVMCPTCLAASRTSSVFSAGSRRCSFVVVVVSSSTGVDDASPARLLFVECWCLIASAENTLRLKNNATIIVAASIILFEITEDCRRRMNDDDDDRIISSLTRAFTTRRAVLCVGGGFLSFPAGLKNQKCETLNNLYSYASFGTTLKNTNTKVPTQFKKRRRQILFVKKSRLF